MNAEQDQPTAFGLIVRALLVAAGLAILIATAAELLRLLVLAFGAAVIAILVRGLSDPLAQWTKLSGRAATILVMLLISAAAVLFAWLFEQRISGQFDRLFETLPAGWRSVRERIAEIPGGEELLQSIQEGAEGNVLTRLANALGMIAAAITDLLLILFGAIFIALNPGLYRRGLVVLMPKRLRPAIDEALGDSERALRLWMLGQLASAVIIGVLVTIGLTVIGLPGALALGLIAGMLEIVPYAGPILASIPALLVALAQSPQLALMTAAVFLLVQQAEGNFITPYIQQRVVHIPAALMLFGVFAAGFLFGITGLIFAAPLLVVSFVLVKRLYVGEALQAPARVPGKDGA